MKKLKKSVIVITLLVIILILLAYQKVFASNTINLFQKTEYTEDFKKWLELSEEEKKHVMMPRMYAIENTNIVSKNPLYKARMLKASMTSRYSLKDIIPSNVVIRNQQQTNSCWAFATLSSLETNLALANYKKGINLSKIYDFSERHMEYATSKIFANNIENKIGYNRKVGSGGNYQISYAYLTNGSGAIPESEMPFENNENIINISRIQNKTISSQVYDTVVFPNYRYETDEKKAEIMNQIKQHIQNYGSVEACLHGNSSSISALNCYNNDTGAKFCNSSWGHGIDHAVSIIGWDDNYSIDKFAEESRPESNGAWIVKNSWGERIEYKLYELKEEIFNTYKQQCIAKGWNLAEEIPNSFIEQAGYTIENDIAYIKYGDNGLIYVSYEDINISKQMAGIVKATDTVNYDFIYQYDEFFPAGGLTTQNNSNIMLCNVFNKRTTGTEYLTQVSLYASETYTCKVYVNPNGTSKSKNDLQLVSLKAGESETFNAGYHTLEFSEPVEIKANSFAVVIQIQSAEYSLTLPLESKVKTDKTEGEWWDSVTVENGKCFVAIGNNLENCEWMDLGKMTEQNSSLDNGDSTIKAFTTMQLSEDSLKNIEITTPPSKTSYFEGEDFDKTGMVVKANYNSETNYSVTLDSSSYTITNGTNLKAGQTSVTITYKGKSVNQTISVEKYSVVELRIKTPPTKTKYKEGQNFDKTGMVIEATYKDGTTKTISDYTIKNGNNLKANQTQVTISYGEKTVQQPITVTTNSLIEIKVTKAPNKIEYVVGQNFDKTGMIVTGTYQDKTNQEILDYTIENGTNLTKGQSSVTIKYEGKTTTQSITVEEVPKNSNFDKANCNINSTKYYTFSNRNIQEYVVMDIIVNGIIRNTENDNYEYYYYLSSNQDENNIRDWVKITEKQTSNEKLQFKINTKDIKNYEELSNSNTLYLYIKEVAIKGGNQSVAISKSMKMDSDITVETYLDNAKVNNVNLDNNESPGTSNKSDDTTISLNKLPKAGVRNILILILIVSVIGSIVHIRYKILRKYIK